LIQVLLSLDRGILSVSVRYSLSQMSGACSWTIHIHLAQFKSCCFIVIHILSPVASMWMWSFIRCRHFCDIAQCQHHTVTVVVSLHDFLCCFSWFIQRYCRFICNMT
jgi:uncharacterized integral membrane protein